jgi:hypothetical protein
MVQVVKKFEIFESFESIKIQRVDDDGPHHDDQTALFTVHTTTTHPSSSRYSYSLTRSKEYNQQQRQLAVEIFKKIAQQHGGCTLICSGWEPMQYKIFI